MSTRPRLLFLATREPSYSRVQIVLSALQNNFEVVAVVSNASSYVARFADVLWQFLRVSGTSYDVVFLGFFAQPIFPFVRLLCRKPIITDAYLSIYDTFIKDKGIASGSHPLAGLCLFLDRLMLRHSRLLFSDTTANAEYLKSLVRPLAPLIVRLWVSAPTEIYQPLPPVPTRSGFRVFFYGAFIPLQGVETIIRAAALLRDSSIHFQLVGSGQTLRVCQKLDQQLGNTNTSFLPWMAEVELVRCAAEAHLVLGIFGSSAKTLRVIPNKVYGGIAMAKPVLTGDSPAIRELLTPGQDVVTCPMADPQGLADAIQWCSQNPAELAQIARHGYETFSRKASPAVVEKVLKEAIMEEFSRARLDRGS